MSQPNRVQPAYLGPAGEPQSPGALDIIRGFWRSQVVAPQYREDNIKIARAVGLFAVGVVFLRSSWGSALVPVF